MQLYHHPYSLDSQRVRLALEEKGIDYTSYHVNPLTGKNMGSFFFRMNPSAKLPVFQNGSHVLFKAIDIIQYIDRVVDRVAVLEARDAVITTQVLEWMKKVDSWDPKMFTLAHIPRKHRDFVSKFIRRVIISRMTESPDLATVYHTKLREAYETEEKLKDPRIIEESEETLSRLLDDVELQLHETAYIAGEEFTMADCMFIPILVRLRLLGLEEKYINSRPKIAEYYKLMKKRPSYKFVIGRFFSGWRRHTTLLKTAFFLGLRSLFNRY